MQHGKSHSIHSKSADTEIKRNNRVFILLLIFMALTSLENDFLDHQVLSRIFFQSRPYRTGRVSI